MCVILLLLHVTRTSKEVPGKEKESDDKSSHSKRSVRATNSEIIAAAYKLEGWQIVTLTPRSGDRGRDVIAEKSGFGAIRIFDQIKADNPGHVVSANDVRAMAGVISLDQNVSKGIITTTSHFAPGVHEEFNRMIPNRLELRDGKQLRRWLIENADGR